jgi:uncharacterized protein (TIGR00251 family)
MKYAVKVKPNARIDEVIREGEMLIIKTKEPPHEGKANLAVIRLAAQFFKIPRSSVRIVSGLSSRNKVIEITDGTNNQ